MAKPNYDRVKRQKEAMRKQKKQEKLLRKQARATEGEPGETPGVAGQIVEGTPVEGNGPLAVGAAPKPALEP